MKEPAQVWGAGSRPFLEPQRCYQASGTNWGPSCSQVAVKNNIDVFYFSTLYPLHILFVEDGKMGES